MHAHYKVMLTPLPAASLTAFLTLLLRRFNCKLRMGGRRGVRWARERSGRDRVGRRVNGHCQSLWGCALQVGDLGRVENGGECSDALGSDHIARKTASEGQSRDCEITNVSTGR